MPHGAGQARMFQMIRMEMEPLDPGAQAAQVLRVHQAFPLQFPQGGMHSGDVPAQVRRDVGSAGQGHPEHRAQRVGGGW